MNLLRRLSACTAFSLIALAATMHAQSVNAIDPALKSRIDRIAAQVLEQTGVPSASVAIIQRGNLVYSHAYGYARLAADGKPAVEATADMRYSIGSISKQFTAAAILLLQANTSPASRAVAKSPSARSFRTLPAIRTIGPKTM